MGALNQGVDVVDAVIALIPNDMVRLEPERLNGLYRQLGSAGAEDVVCRAVEELAVRLSNCNGLWQFKDNENLRKGARSIVAIADQLGMDTLACVARDVTKAIDANDSVAVAATLTRLLRIGERSLTAIWDMQDLSG